MRTLITSFILLSAPSVSIANNLDDQINKACLRHAVSLVAQLKNDVIGNLSQEKSDQALKLATDSCQAYFKKEFNQGSGTVANSSTKNTEKKESDDENWFADNILNSEPVEKDGLERLKRKRK